MAEIVSNQRNRSSKTLFLGLFLSLGFFANPTHAQSIEVIHFWKSPSELAALDVFTSSFTADGGEWFGSTKANQTEMKAYAIDRIATGNPPSALQWHGGPELQELIELDIAASLESLSQDFQESSLFPTVADALASKKGISALPVGIHGENWVWRNLEIYKTLGLEAPNNWEEFLSHSDEIIAAGYSPIAIGDETWQRTLVFNSILLSVGGTRFYHKVLQHSLDTEADRETLAKIFRIFLGVRDAYLAAEQKSGDWLEATESVIEGRAALQVMGDWAKGEFLQAGKTLGSDFDCSLSLGGGIVVVVLDVFVLPDNPDTDVRSAQTALIETVLNPENQRQYSILKGSLPVVSHVDQDGFDQCATAGLEALKKPEGSVPAYLLALPQEGSAFFVTALEDIWVDHDATPESAAELFIHFIEKR